MLYIYQDFNNPITFPALPVSWNIDLLLEYESFFAWIDEEPRLEQEVQQRLKSIDAAAHDRVYQLLLPADAEGYIFLSPAGAILWERINQQRQEGKTLEEPPASEIAPGEKISSSIQGVKHHYPSGTLDIAKKIAELPAVIEIIGGNFEPTTLRRVKGISDDGSIRLLWADNDKAANLTIRTTARGQAQTLAFSDKYIRPLLSR